MGILLQGYQVNQPTWFYLSTLLSLAVFFRFNRVWSWRNLDLLLLLSASPGLLLVEAVSPTTKAVGYGWLIAISALFLVRLFIDPLLERRPTIGQNLNTGGLAFLCVAAAAFLTGQALSESLPQSTTVTVEQADALINRVTIPEANPMDEAPIPGPAPAMIAAPVNIVFANFAPRILALLAHAAVVFGLLMAGKRLFGDLQLGLAMGTLYLLLPCTAYDVGEFNHVLPAAMTLWAVVCHRRPVTSGILLGLACGTMFFPVFLLPLWLTYYGRRGGLRFAGAWVATTAVLVGSLALTSSDPESFVRKTLGMFDIATLAFGGPQGTEGFWMDAGYLSVYRTPVIALYAIMVICLTVWPSRKSVEHLLAHSAAIVVGTQFWYTRQGGVFLLWYLPLLLLVVFRPRMLNRLPFDQDLSEDSSIRARRSDLAGTGTTVPQAHILR